MNLPDKIKIGGHFYKVLYPYVFTERFDRCGDIDNEKNVIRVTETSYDEERTYSVIMVTFIHELLHGLDHKTGFHMFDSENGEARIEALSEGIYQLLVDNKDSLYELFKSLKLKVERE